MTHFVFPYYAKPAKGFEISYACKSIKKFYQDKFKLFIVGDHPRFKGIEFINCPRIQSGKGREIDVFNKLQQTVKSNKINKNFVWIYDDIMFIDKVKPEDLQRPIAYDYVHDLKKYLEGRKVSKGYYQRKFAATMTILKKEGLPQWDYETHLPRTYDKDKAQYIIDKYKLLENVYLFATLYFNNFEKAPWSTVKKLKKFKAELYKPHEPLMVKELTKGKKILNYSDRALNKHFDEYVKGILKN